MARVRRRDEDLDRLGHRGAHLLGPLDLDLEHDRVARRRRSARPRSAGSRSGCRCRWRTRGSRSASIRRSNSSGERKWYSRPSTSPCARLPRRRRDRELEVGNALAAAARSASPCRLPTGPVITKTFAIDGRKPASTGRRSGRERPGRVSPVAAAGASDELGALALGEPADRLRRRDPALVEDPVRLDPTVLGDGEEHVEDLRGQHVVGRVEEQRRGCSPCPLSGPSSAWPGRCGCRSPA